MTYIASQPLPKAQTLPIRLPNRFFFTCSRLGILPTASLLWVRAQAQTMILLRRLTGASASSRPQFSPVKKFQISTSRFGTGQSQGSHQTPLGLHRIAAKIGAGYPVGSVWKHRQFAGLSWLGHGQAPIAHRILWLEGLEPGLNQGGNVDTFSRYIYIHGLVDETTLGRPASIGCIHLAALDLLPLFDQIPLQTLVWITCC